MICDVIVIPSILVVYILYDAMVQTMLTCSDETAHIILFPCDLIVPLMTRMLLVNILIRGTMSIFLERLSLRPPLIVISLRILKIQFSLTIKI